MTHTFTRVGLDALLPPENCAVLLIDHQPSQLANVNSHEPTMVINNVTALAKTAKAYGIPTILTTINAKRLAQPAIHAMGDGYDVYAVTDASGGVSLEAHDMAIRRVVAAGAQPITWLAMAGELQRDWARTERLGAVAQMLFDHAGASGTVLAWELANEATRA
jgi:nicotinamidase-related amidase